MGLFPKNLQQYLTLSGLPRGSNSKVFLVDSVNGSDSNPGTNPEAPLATLDYAIGLCTANAGDIIILAPKHAETINAASAIDVDVAGVSIIGLGKGNLRPTITCGSDETATTVTLASAGMYMENVLFVVGVDSLAVMIEVDADDVTINNCEFREGSAKQAIKYIDVDGGGANECDRFKLYNSRILSTAAGSTDGVELGQVQDGVELVGNYIDGDFSSAGIYSASVCTNLLLKDNVVANRQTGDHAIELTAACTGFAVDNRMYADTLGTILDPGSLKCLGNLETDAIDQAGVDSPRTSAGGLPADSITAAALADDAIDWAAFADDTAIGQDNANNSFASTNVAANADGSILERLEYLQAGTTFQSVGLFVPGLGYRVTKVEDTNAAGDDLFTVTGKVMVTLMTGEVTDALGATAVADYVLSIKTTSEALCAATTITADAAGTMYVVTGDTGAILNGVDAPTTRVAQTSGTPHSPLIVGMAGETLTISSVHTATGDAGDAITWTLFYLPLEASAAVAAAA